MDAVRMEQQEKQGQKIIVEFLNVILHPLDVAKMDKLAKQVKLTLVVMSVFTVAVKMESQPN